MLKKSVFYQLFLIVPIFIFSFSWTANSLISKTQKKLHNELFKAIKNNNIGKILQILVLKDINLLNTNINGAYPIDLAVQFGHKNLIKTFVKNTTEINSLGSDGFNAFHKLIINKAHFSEKKILEYIKLFVQHGASINLESKSGSTALHLASSRGYVNVVDFLINNGAKLNALNNKKFTALHEAVKKGHYSVVKLLLSHGVNPSLLDISGCTPLHLATKKDNYHTVDLLIKYGSDINILDLKNQTALDYALKNNKVSTISLLFADSKLNGLKYLKYKN